jgi:hypothetical protein
MADGKEVAQELVKAGLAVPYDGGRKKRWCTNADAGPLIRSGMRMVLITDVGYQCPRFFLPAVRGSKSSQRGLKRD